MFKLFYCSISDRRPKRMFNVREVLDLLDISDIISDEERQTDSEDDYYPVQKLNNQRTKTLTDESSDESTDHGTPEPSTFESKKTHNRSEYRWKKICLNLLIQHFVGGKLKLVRLNRLYHTSWSTSAMPYFRNLHLKQINTACYQVAYR